MRDKSKMTTQVQSIDVTELIKEMKLGECAKYSLSRLFDRIEKEFEKERTNFQKSWNEKTEKTSFYTFCYPFVPFGNDTWNTVAEIVGFKLSEEDELLVEQDRKNVEEWNAKVKEIKEKEEKKEEDKK